MIRMSKRSREEWAKIAREYESAAKMFDRSANTCEETARWTESHGAFISAAPNWSEARLYRTCAENAREGATIAHRKALPWWRRPAPWWMKVS